MEEWVEHYTTLNRLNRSHSMEAPGGITDSIDLMTKTNITGMWKHDIENFDDDRIVDNLDALRLSIRSFPRLLDVNIGSGEEVAIATEMVDSTSD